MKHEIRNPKEGPIPKPMLLLWVSDFKIPLDLESRISSFLLCCLDNGQKLSSY
ncbi:hypothetical protein BH10PLA2_BH10PLA2_23360 [soil metagenome]